MDSQIPRQQGLDSKEVMEGEEGQGKTSMFTKVKTKVRKIKDTLLTKTGRDGNQNDQSPDEDEVEDEGMVEDSEAHDAVPMPESPEVMNTVAGQKPAVKLENPTPAAAEDRYDSKYTDPQTRPFSQWPQEENTGEHGVDTGIRPTGGMEAAGGGDVPENRGDSFSSAGNFGTPPGSESAANFVHREGGYMGQPKISTETPISVEEDPHAPKDQPEPEVSSYQSKVADPTDAVSMHESPEVMTTVARQKPADKLENPTPAAEDRYDSKYTDPQTRPFPQWPEDDNTGEHGVDTGIRPTGGMVAAGGGDVPENRGDSFSSAGNFGTPPGSESAANFVHRQDGYMGQPKITTETPMSMEEDPHAPKDRPEVSNYQSKVADPTGAGGEEAGVSSILQSFNKMNVKDEPESEPISERAPETYTGSHDDFSPEPINLPPSTLNTHDPESVLKSSSFDANETGVNPPLDKLRPSEEDKALSEVMSDSLRNRKGEVEGVGGEEGENEKKPVTEFEEVREHLRSDQDSNREMTETEAQAGSPEIGKPATGYGSAIAGKAIAAKGVVVSKLGYGGATEDPTAASPETNQGGEEIGKSTTGYGQKIVSAVAPVYEKASNIGKPLRSDQDSNREMTKNEAQAGSPGKGYVESVKGTVASWFSKGGDQKQTSDEASAPGGPIPGEERFSDSIGEEAVGHVQNGVGERRLQESGN